jgi:hypothetical protein
LSVACALARRLAAAAVAATTGLAILAVAAAPSAEANVASLHIAGTPVKLPGSSELGAVSEAPNGSVYYASGPSVYIVSGSSASLVLTVNRPVLAVAASSDGLFAEAGRTVTEYNSTSSARLGAPVRTWTLRSPRVPTAAGLYAVGSALWAWTDYAVDGGSLEYANVYRFSVSSATVDRVSAGEAYPGEMAADATGAYYQAEIRNASYLVHVTPAGVMHRVRYSGIGLQLALSGGRVEFLAYHVSHGRSTIYLDSYSQVALARGYSRRASVTDRAIAGTGAGLLLLSDPCGTLACSSARVSELRSRNGVIKSTVAVTGALALVAGRAAAAVSFQNHAYYLVRLSS